jgi:phospholipid/cholesterol/gamma-HCH transport system permease protein
MSAFLFLHRFGKYCELVFRAFRKPDNWAVLREMTLREMDALGVGSIGIVSIISLFMGAVISIQMAANIDSPLIPLYTIGYATRESVILEFSSTVVALILAGKVGSSIASEIGTMRVTEQIDALEIMGVNSAGFLILPKILASLIVNPILTLVSMFLGIWGGYFACTFTGMVEGSTYQLGILYEFDPGHVRYSLIKALVFAFLISSIASFRGYYVEGGSREVGMASTKAVVNASISILFWNLILTRLLLL